MPQRSSKPGVLVLSLLAAGFARADAAAPLHLNNDRGTVITRHGSTRLTAGAAVAEITIRPASPAEHAAGHITACSGGWQDCALVDRLSIKVGGQDIDVPRRALLMLSDILRGQLIRLGSGQYELDLSGGDAAASYEARLFFDRRRVTRLDIWAGEAGQLEESIVFHDLSHAFR